MQADGWGHAGLSLLRLYPLWGLYITNINIAEFFTRICRSKLWALSYGWHGAAPAWSRTSSHLICNNLICFVQRWRLAQNFNLLPDQFKLHSFLRGWTNYFSYWSRDVVEGEQTIWGPESCRFNSLLCPHLMSLCKTPIDTQSLIAPRAPTASPGSISRVMG